MSVTDFVKSLPGWLKVNVIFALECRILFDRNPCVVVDEQAGHIGFRDA